MSGDIPDTVPSWLIAVKEDIATIKTNTSNQGREIGELKDNIAALDDDVDKLVKETGILESQFKSHIDDEGRHVGVGEIEDVVDKTLTKYERFSKPREWVDNHQVISIGGIITVIIGTIELLKGGVTL